MNKKILITLGISLALNFIFIGFETAKAIYQPKFSDIPSVRPPFTRPDIRSMKGPDFQNKKMMFKAFKSAMKNHREEMKNARKEVEETLKAEKFDAEKFKAAMQKATAVRNTIDAAVQENMTEMLSKMDPKERSRFAEHFARKHHHSKHFRRSGPRGHNNHTFHRNKGAVPFAAKHRPCPRKEGRTPCPCLKNKIE